MSSVCSFWLAGTCKFADKCRFAHSDVPGSAPAPYYQPPSRGRGRGQFSSSGGNPQTGRHPHPQPQPSGAYYQAAPQYSQPAYHQPPSMHPPKKDKFCNEYQKGDCQRNPCSYLHGWSRNGDIQLLTRGSLQQPITAAAVITPTQIGLSDANGKISVYDVQVGQVIAEFETGNSIYKLHLHTLPTSCFLWYGGGASS